MHFIGQTRIDLSKAVLKSRLHRLQNVKGQKGSEAELSFVCSHNAKEAEREQTLLNFIAIRNCILFTVPPCGLVPDYSVELMDECSSMRA